MARTAERRQVKKASKAGQFMFVSAFVERPIVRPIGRIAFIMMSFLTILVSEAGLDFMGSLSNPAELGMGKLNFP